jgi:O-succinylhomoserine sulfhydrylase
VFDSAAQAAARFSVVLKKAIFIRASPIPLFAHFEQRLAALEGGERAVATSSGMAAIMATCMALLQVRRSCAVFTQCIWYHQYTV